MTNAWLCCCYMSMTKQPFVSPNFRKKNTGKLEQEKVTQSLNTSPPLLGAK